MRKILLPLFGLFLCTAATAQKKKHTDEKVFWKEDFRKGKIPAGWINADINKKGCTWICTDQPYPGSYQYQQQAPPIASKSRGYYLLYEAGYFVDEDQPSWVKNGVYPDAYIQTAPISCSGHTSVVLRFQETFRWNNAHMAPGAGLFVGISNDSIHWKYYDAIKGAAPATDMLTPVTKELNISKIAAGQSHVYLRFYWKGLYSWYWMIDDIELAEAYGKDVSISRLVSNTEEGNHFTTHNILALKIKNSGSKDITTPFGISCLLDNKTTLHATMQADPAHPFKADSAAIVKFPPVDLSRKPIHSLRFKAALPGDEHAVNDLLYTKISAAETRLGNISGFIPGDNTFTFASGPSKVKVIFYRDDIFRIWLAPDGNFTNPADSEIVVSYHGYNPHITWKDADNYYEIQSDSCTLRAYKRPLRFALLDKTNTRVVWEEARPLAFGATTVQTLKSRPDEYFYGCGMQNGSFSYHNKEVLIEKGGGWDAGGRPNPAPFYMSTSGYGAFRNTFDIGRYNFRDTITLSHREDRFDCFYFYGPGLKKILNDYTLITGRPFMIPRWGLSMGDANCYNKNGMQTPDVIHLIADKYVSYHMPRGWILPNDGYGCGYVKLDSTVKELAKRGFHTGLWTENGVKKIAREVGQDGTRLCKLDVAWVGPGYRFALDACRSAYNGIQDNSSARGFVWSVMGWSGTQRYSTIWSGDQSGNWEYIRFHIPTVLGAGLSGFNCATGDVDGIFRGSDSTYTRDLEWKCFIPVFMAMSGWAPKNKQPWVYGEPYTDINRKYLMLKMRLTPYLYSYCADAHQTGVPTVRAMVLEYPRDSTTWGKATQYQFMSGKYLLVAPVYKSGAIRDSVYLPEGTWTDYWNGARYKGGQWLRNFAAPLGKLPVFVRQGAILPMYPAMEYDGQRPADTLTLDIYPHGSSSFNLYEDDGSTQAYSRDASARTMIDVNQSLGKNSLTGITIHAAKGNYRGKYTRRIYLIDVHTARAPQQVKINGKIMKRYSYGDHPAEAGWHYDPDDRKGTLHIATSWLATSKTQQLKIN